jgi:Ser-tRNA(Ala) deacylase AlaX
VDVEVGTHVEDAAEFGQVVIAAVDAKFGPGARLRPAQRR